MSAVSVSAGLRGRRAGIAGALTHLGIALGLLCVVGIIHIGIGSRYIPPTAVLNALLSYDSTNFDHKIVVELRLLRLAAGILTGGALAVAGVLLQSIIRNPLGEPHILGLNAGAALAVVIGMVAGIPWLAGSLARPFLATIGAAILFALIMGISSAGRGGPTPLKVTLCGVALSAFASSITSALLIIDDQALLDLRIWLAGDLSGLSYAALSGAAVFSLLGLALASFLAPSLNILELGDIAAAGLGINLPRTRIVGLVTAALLCGAAVSVAGPIGFIGLVVPHAVKRFATRDMRMVIPLSVIAGAILLLLADILARIVVAPQELATGVMTAIIGAPIFIFIASRFFR